MKDTRSCPEQTHPDRNQSKTHQCLLVSCALISLYINKCQVFKSPRNELTGTEIRLILKMCLRSNSELLFHLSADLQIKFNWLYYTLYILDVQVYQQNLSHF